MIFVLDLDGTLIDSNQRHYVLMDELLKKTSYAEAFNAEEFMKYKALGNSGKKYLVNVLKMSDTEATDIMSQWGEHIEDEEYVLMDKLYSDAIHFLDVLKKKNISIVFLTARKSKSTVMKQLERLGLAKYPDDVYVVSPRNSAEGKMDVLQVYVSAGLDTVIVGDTENEYDTAYAVGVNYFILNRGFRSEEYWNKRGVKTLNNLDELSQIIDDGY